MNKPDELATVLIELPLLLAEAPPPPYRYGPRTHGLPSDGPTYVALEAKYEGRWEEVATGDYERWNGMGIELAAAAVNALPTLLDAATELAHMTVERDNARAVEEDRIAQKCGVDADSDPRVRAWLDVAVHPFFADCYQAEGTLLDAVLAKLDAASAHTCKPVWRPVTYEEIQPGWEVRTRRRDGSEVTWGVAHHRGDDNDWCTEAGSLLTYRAVGWTYETTAPAEPNQLERGERFAEPHQPEQPTKYRKRPVVIEAIHWHKGLTPTEAHALTNIIEREWGYPWLVGNALQPRTLHQAGAHGAATKGIWIDPADGALMIRTLEGDMKVSPGDYIIRGVQGELYPCRGDIFRQTYEPADADDHTQPEGETHE